MRALARLILFVGMSLALALAPLQAAMAHAQLLTTNPVESAVLDAAPTELALTFNEPVSPLAIRLVTPNGAIVDVTDKTSGGTSVAIAVPALGTGTHVLSWRVVSADGHPISGSLVFSIGAVTGASTVDLTADPATSLALLLAKAALFIALAIGVGGAAFRAVAEIPTALRPFLAALCVFGIVLAPVSLGLHGLDALGLPLSAFPASAPWSAGLATSYGATAIAMALAFALAAVSLCLPAGPATRFIGAGAGVLAALSLSLSGHASAAAPRWLTRPAVFLHLAGVLFWVGALLPLWWLLRSRSAASDHAIAVFSRGIPYAVAPLLISGLTLAFIQMGPPSPQWLSPYGAILAAKLGLLAVLFSLALWNRAWLTQPALAGDTKARKHLQVSIGVEMAIVVVILGLVAGWRFTPPPRALTDVASTVQTAEPILLHAMTDEVMAMVTVTPGSVGPVTLDIALTDMNYAPVAAEGVSITLVSPSLGIEPIKRTATETPSGWQVEGLTIPVAGDWLLDIEMRLSRFELTKAQAELTIP